MERAESATPASLLRAALEKSRVELESALGAQRWRAFEPFLESGPPVASGPPEFCHADFDLDHLLLDRETGAVTGVIDWADAYLGDPTIDFAALEIRCGDEFVARMLDAYEPDDRAAFHRRIRDSAKRLSVVWLAETLRMDPEVWPLALRDFDRIFGTRDV